MKHFCLLLLVLLISNIFLADAFLWRHLFSSSKGRRNSTDPMPSKQSMTPLEETSEKSIADVRTEAKKPEPKIAGAANGKSCNTHGRILEF